MEKKNILGKKELVDAMSVKGEIFKKDAENAINIFVDVLTELLVNGETIRIPGLGTFEVVERAAREGRNPRTGETMMVEASKSPKFKPSKTLKDCVNG